MRRKKSGTDRFSPAVWVAVKALSEFVETYEKNNNKHDVPANIIDAIIELTSFLNMVASMTDASPLSLSPGQTRLKELFMRQKEQRRKQIETILKIETSDPKADKGTTDNVTEKSSSEQVLLVSEQNVQEIDNISNAFNFQTLPVL